LGQVCDNETIDRVQVVLARFVNDAQLALAGAVRALHLPLEQRFRPEKGLLRASRTRIPAFFFF
jgi:hypothetical protein